tara:strand:- start:722 stop:886 length:165 start_codon:yes stop_codon:yes gene_type:complete
MISPERKTVEDILSSSKITYKVPTYQRSFEWGKKSIEKRSKDLANEAFDSIWFF